MDYFGFVTIFDHWNIYNFIEQQSLVAEINMFKRMRVRWRKTFLIIFFFKCQYLCFLFKDNNNLMVGEPEHLEETHKSSRKALSKWDRNPGCLVINTVKSCIALVIWTPPLKRARKNSQLNFLTSETERNLGKDHARGDPLPGLIGAKWQTWQNLDQGPLLSDISGFLELLPAGLTW